MRLRIAIAVVSLAGCATDPELDTTEQDLSRGQIATLNQIGQEVGMSYQWVAPQTRGAPAQLGVHLEPTTGVVRTATASGLGGGFESRFEVDANTIDPCWFLDVGGEGQSQSVVSVRSTSGAGGTFGNAAYKVAGGNYTIEGLAEPPSPDRASWDLRFVVRDAAGNVVFDSTAHH